VSETENVVISPHATDIDSDVLTYFINDSKFIKDGNVFVWTTGYDDAGKYSF